MASDTKEMSMTPAERAKASIILVESDPQERQNLKVALRTLGYGNISDCPNHQSAVERIAQKKVTHVIFEAKKTNIRSDDFLRQVLGMDSSIISIPSSFEPNVDDVFELLIIGAKGYLCKPFTAETVEAAILNASKGEPFPDAVLYAKNRNEALVAVLMSSIDKAATILRQSQQFETAKREIPRALAGMKRSADLAKTFSKGGTDGLLEAMENFCIERSKGPATRLGRLRKRLKTDRVEDEVVGEAK